jgi:hypothetical protein
MKLDDLGDSRLEFEAFKINSFLCCFFRRQKLGGVEILGLGFGFGVGEAVEVELVVFGVRGFEKDRSDVR